MEIWMLCLHCAIIFVPAFMIEQSHGCQPQVCRRRRAVTDGTVKLLLDGCSAAGSPPWVRQVAYCLKVPATTMAFRMKKWYATEYESCRGNGCSAYISGDKGSGIIDSCVKCWKGKLHNAPLFDKFDVNRNDVEKCIDEYIYAFLSDDLPTVEYENGETRFKSHILLPDVRPSEHWWSVTVKLPCQPKSFVYWNAYCANSFAEHLDDGDYVLVQNKLITANGISFFVEFSDTCKFRPTDVNILWNESFPASSLPQLSSFPSQVSPLGDEAVTIFYNQTAANRLQQTDGGMPAEWQIASRKSRIKRQAPATRLGVLFPCSVKYFRPADPPAETLELSGAGKRYLIRSDIGSMSRSMMLNFTLNFGFNETGCIFNSGEVNVVPDPPRNWLDSDTSTGYNRLPYKPKIRGIVCTTCVNMQSDLDCFHRGNRRVCASGEICQTEVRQIRKNLRLITKSCKQINACKTEALLPGGQCQPQWAGSVCRCCCASSMCNSGNNPCKL